MKLTLVLANITSIEQHVDAKDKDREPEIKLLVKRDPSSTKGAELRTSTKDAEKDKVLTSDAQIDTHTQRERERENERER